MSNYAVDRKKWSSLDIFEQMGNVYSEVGRSFNAQKRNDNLSAEQARDRAIDLLDATLEDLRRRKSYRYNEVKIVKQVFMEDYEKKRSTLDNYLLQFALVARSRR